MRSIAMSVAAGGLALAATAAAGQASAQTVIHRVGYYTTYRPETHYVRRTVVVPQRVWRPVRHRVVRRVYVAPTYAYRTYDYAPRYAYGYGYGDDDAWRRAHWRREHERWEHERWEHGGY